MTPGVDIVIVNWNAGEHLAACVHSVLASQCVDFMIERIVVVDNGSGDGSTAFISTLPRVLLVENRANRGFAVACNQGAALGSAGTILFLNPDVSMSPGALHGAMAEMAAPGNDDVGITGIRLVDGHGRLQLSCARFPTPLTMVAGALALDRLLPRIFPPHFLPAAGHDRTRDVDQVMGAFFLVRRDVYQALKGFDERFFVYFEDLDFALRAHKAGWRSRYVMSVSAQHIGGVSSGQVPGRRLLYWLRSRLNFALKHFGTGAAMTLLVASALVEPWLRVVWTLLHGHWRGTGDVLSAYRVYVCSAFALLAYESRHAAGAR